MNMFVDYFPNFEWVSGYTKKKKMRKAFSREKIE